MNLIYIDLFAGAGGVSTGVENARLNGDNVAKVRSSTIQTTTTILAMKGTENFKNVIQTKLNEMAAADPIFAEKLKNENKNIDDCITYIINWVQQSERNGFLDDEIYGQAAHYYDEDTIDIGKPISCRVVVNQKVELTEEEVQAAKKAALDKVIAEEQERIRKKVSPVKKTEPEVVQQGSLF